MRHVAGIWLLVCMASVLAGLFQAVSGNGAVSVTLTLASVALLVQASNAKHAMLGEPLLFSDLALLGAVFRHPQFYLSAVPPWQRVLIGLATAIIVAILVWLSTVDLGAHLTGIALFGCGFVLLALSLRLMPPACLVPLPDAHRDTHRFGLLPVLLLYWLRWRDSRDPQSPPAMQGRRGRAAPDLILIIQCESFADPAELFDDPTLALPALSFAREQAWQWGRLEVSGFGAYTMRTEYGVLFGRDEDALGFRRYDPYLTALRETAWSLPARLEGWRCIFAHPHDMRFYGRDRIMPACGFVELIDEAHYKQPQTGEGRYVTDEAIKNVILSLAENARQPSLIYAVTIENHGPWVSDDGDNLVDGYLRLARNGDKMLADLIHGLTTLGRPAALVFFGDHRPSIPGATGPGGDRHTPYVVLRFDGDSGLVRGSNRSVDLTPAALNKVILDVALDVETPGH